MQTFFVLFVILFVLGVALCKAEGHNHIRAGSCGSSLTWSLNSEGTLLIQGSGYMFDYDPGFSPWFDDRSTIKSVTIEEGALSIGCHIFEDCMNLNSLVIPSSVSLIGESAFKSCVSLTSMNISSNVNVIGNDAFFDCTKMERIDVDKENPNYASVEGVLFNRECTTLIQYPIGNTRTSYTVPETVNEIGEFSFHFSTYLEYLVISSNVRLIGLNALSHCIGLKYIKVEEDNPSYKSVDGVLFGSDCISLIRYPSRNNSVSYVIPSSVKSIGAFAFCSSRNLLSVTIPDGVEIIGYASFYNCTQLKSVMIPDTVTSIGTGAFSDCSSLTSVVIPGSVSSIGLATFSGCVQLESVFFRGSYDIEPSRVVFPRVSTPNLRNICVSPDYNSTSFCSVNVTFEALLCKSFQSMFDNCSMGSYVNETVVKQKRKHAMDWESRTNGCMKYQCDNDAGLVSWSICNSTKEMNQVCMNEQCQEKKTKMDDKVVIEIEFNSGVNVSDMNSTSLVQTLNAKFGIDVDDIMIGWEVDEQGYLISVVLYLNDDETTEMVIKALEKMEEGDKCEYGILCRKKSIHVTIPEDRPLSLSGAYRLRINNMINVMFSILSVGMMIK